MKQLDSIISKIVFCGQNFSLYTKLISSWEKIMGLAALDTCILHVQDTLLIIGSEDIRLIHELKMFEKEILQQVYSCINESGIKKIQFKKIQKPKQKKSLCIIEKLRHKKLITDKERIIVDSYQFDSSLKELLLELYTLTQ